MKKVFLMFLMVLFCLACSSKPAKADVEQFNRVVFSSIDSFSFSGEQLNFTMSGKADSEEEVNASGTYNSNGLTFHTSNFKKVQSYQIKHKVLKKLMFYWEDATEEE